MKYFLKIFVFAVSVMFVAAALPAQAAQPGKVVFCEEVSKDWKPVNPANEFDTNVVSWIAYAPKPFGAPKILLTLYYKKDNSAPENLIFREEIDVKPAWNALIIKDVPLPEVGMYSVALDRLNGDPLSAGTVRIKKRDVEEKMPEKVESDGVALEGLFNKFKPQN